MGPRISSVLIPLGTRCLPSSAQIYAVSKTASEQSKGCLGTVVPASEEPLKPLAKDDAELGIHTASKHSRQNPALMVLIFCLSRRCTSNLINKIISDSDKCCKD